MVTTLQCFVYWGDLERNIDDKQEIIAVECYQIWRKIKWYKSLPEIKNMFVKQYRISFLLKNVWRKGPPCAHKRPTFDKNFHPVSKLVFCCLNICQLSTCSLKVWNFDQYALLIIQRLYNSVNMKLIGYLSFWGVKLINLWHSMVILAHHDIYM